MATATAVRAPAPPATRPVQNWVLDPVQDALFIIAAPLLMLALAVPALRAWGPDTVFGIFVLFNVAHHLPTFLRIYGDVDLFRRFKWSFLIGPIIPFSIAMVAMAYLIRRGLSLDSAFYLFILVNIWDPWHFLMQHYGFMRIYDRPNAAPRSLAARMDLLLCSSWFLYIMLASANWLPEMLYQLYRDASIPLVFAVGLAGLHPLELVALGVALAATAAYGAYLAWCARRGYYISAAKLVLFAVTFATMWLTYTPNRLIRAISPGWSFRIGFATLGMVHVTQYLAIVWKFNRSLAGKPGRARSGPFRWLHARGGILAASGYVALCLAYGWAISHQPEPGGSPWPMALVLAAGFTSTLMHYYFDGFMWKIRHQQNRENLAMTEGQPASPVGAPEPAPARREAVSSWWDGARRSSAARTLVRQALYFGLPLAVLTAGAYLVWNDPVSDPERHQARAVDLFAANRDFESMAEARRAVAAYDRQLALEEAMIAVRPSAVHYAQMARMIADRSHVRSNVLGTLRSPSGLPTAEDERAHREELRRAVATMEHALSLGEPLDAGGRWGGSRMDRPSAQALLAAWRKELAPRAEGPRAVPGHRSVEGR